MLNWTSVGNYSSIFQFETLTGRIFLILKLFGKNAMLSTVLGIAISKMRLDSCLAFLFKFGIHKKTGSLAIPELQKLDLSKLTF